jgi:hypothetical protein
VTEKTDISPANGNMRLLRRVILVLMLAMGFRTFQFFPGMTYVQEAWFVLCFLIVLLFYPYLRLRGSLRFARLEFYLFLLIVADVLIAAWQAHQVFGQPIIYGILAQRSIALVAILPILLDALGSGIAELADIEAALLSLAWGTAALYTAMRLFLNPSNFTDYGDGFVTRAMPGEDPSFKFAEVFVLFGVFYYAMLGIRTRKTRHYVVALALFLTTLGASGRGLTVCVAATLLFFLYRLRGLRKALNTALKFSCVVVPLMGAIYFIAPTLVSTRLTGFANAFTVVLTGSATTTDASANARIFESLTALPYIQEHPLIGNGVVSHQWQGGNGSSPGDNFFAADIGVIGIVFSYGILGFLLFLFQYRFAWRAAKRLPDSFYSPLLDATKAFLLFTALYTLETGTCVWTAEVTLFFVVLMVGFAKQSFSLRFFDVRTGKECSLQKPALSL